MANSKGYLIVFSSVKKARINIAKSISTNPTKFSEQYQLYIKIEKENTNVTIDNGGGKSTWPLYYSNVKIPDDFAEMHKMYQIKQ